MISTFCLNHFPREVHSQVKAVKLTAGLSPDTYQPDGIKRPKEIKKTRTLWKFQIFFISISKRDVVDCNSSQIFIALDCNTRLLEVAPRHAQSLVFTGVAYHLSSHIDPAACNNTSTAIEFPGTMKNTTRSEIVRFCCLAALSVATPQLSSAQDSPAADLVLVSPLPGATAVAKTPRIILPQFSTSS